MDEDSGVGGSGEKGCHDKDTGLSEMRRAVVQRIVTLRLRAAILRL